MTLVSEELTVEALATQADTRTSTIRMYQSRGLLDPPGMRGRVGYYTQAHLDRLKAIARLQERGYSLAAIKELFEGWSSGAKLGDLLGLASRREPATLSMEDFAALFPSGEVDPAVVQRSVALGLVAFDEAAGALRVPSPTFVEVGKALAGHGVPTEVQLDEYESLVADVKRIAERYVALFEKYLVGDEPAAASPERLAELGAAMDQFRGLAREFVGEALEMALDQAASAAAAKRESSGHTSSDHTSSDHGDR